MPTSPDLKPKPKLARWMFERGISAQSAASELGCSTQTVRNITRPFGDPRRTVPHEDLMGRIVGWTKGEIVAGDFYPDHLNGRELAVAEEARP